MHYCLHFTELLQKLLDPFDETRPGSSVIRERHEHNDLIVAISGHLRTNVTRFKLYTRPVSSNTDAAQGAELSEDRLEFKSGFCFVPAANIHQLHQYLGKYKMRYVMTLAARCKYQCAVLVRFDSSRRESEICLLLLILILMLASLPLVLHFPTHSSVIWSCVASNATQSGAKHAHYYTVPVFLFLYLSDQNHLLD
jgi:hypothetical protein